MTQKDLQTTKHGGLRRTRAAQRIGTAQDVSVEPPTIARVDGKGGIGGAHYLVGHLPDKEKVGGSNPSSRTKLVVKWRERLGIEPCPYVIRWRVETPWASVRLHHWLSNDDPRAFHDHPWDFVTIVLRGGYVDSSPSGDEHLRAPAVRRRSALHQHTVFPDPGGAWTIVLTGPKIRPWGFWVKGKFRRANKYFMSYGHHPCE